jgi:hypothetical protein
MPACAISCRWPSVRLPNHKRYSLLANSISSLPSGATEIDASSASSTVVKRSNDEDSCSRMRLGSVMSVIEVIQPVCVPRASISGDTYSRASNSVLSGRLTRICTPAGVKLAAEFLVEHLGQRLMVGVGPVGEGRGAADQFGFAPAGHLAERRRSHR